MQKIKKFFAGVKKEMSRVRWPKKKDMIKYSVAVLACIIVFAAFFINGEFQLFNSLVIAAEVDVFKCGFKIDVAHFSIPFKSYSSAQNRIPNLLYHKSSVLSKPFCIFPYLSSKYL